MQITRTRNPTRASLPPDEYATRVTKTKQRTMRGAPAALTPVSPTFAFAGVDTAAAKKLAGESSAERSRVHPRPRRPRIASSQMEVSERLQTTAAKPDSKIRAAELASKEPVEEEPEEENLASLDRAQRHHSSAKPHRSWGHRQVSPVFTRFGYERSLVPCSQFHHRTACPRYNRMRRRFDLARS